MAAVFAGVATWLLVADLGRRPGLPAPIHVPWWALSLAFAATEVFVIHLERGRETHTFSLGEIPLVVGLYLAGPLSLVASRLLGSGLALVVHRRQRPAKLLFNLSLFSLETCVAVEVFRGLGGSHLSIAPGSWPAIFAACVLANVLGAVAVTLAIAATSGTLTARTVVQLLIETAAVGPLANISVGLCVTIMLWFEPAGALLMLLIAGVIVLAYRGYVSLRGRYAKLNKLYEFNQRTQRGGDGEDMVAAMLDAARTVMNAEACRLLLITDDASRALSVVVDGRGPAVNDHGAVALDPLWPLATRSPGGLLIPAGTGDDSFRQALAQLGWRDCVAAVIYREETPRGLIAVGSHLSNVTTFDREDLALFNALASHAQVILDNSELVNQLRYDALHDSLTSLPNRSLFNREVETALGQRTGDEKVAVVLMDLDRFKDVNDTLGHHHGDRLLVEVGKRLARAAVTGSVVARLGGDEFAVLLPPAGDNEAFCRQADSLGAVLRERFDIGDMEVEAPAAIGIAVCPDHGKDAITLLQKADVAMYASKASGQVEIYSPERDGNSRRRLGLVAQLRTAIRQGEIEVWYQPQADAVSGKVVAVEALVRWRHRTRGLIPPDDFIPVAEQTGLIGPLANHVVSQVARQWRAWQDAGLTMEVSVNASMRNLQDQTFAASVCRRLEGAGMPPSALTVEITESSIMSDSNRTLSSINALAARGIGISVDDFGTGYSSLSHLRQLPVREIKIDKSFVMNLNDDSQDGSDAIVRAVIDLGRNLGLSVVAEGVESAAVRDQLVAWGCHRIQGFHLAKPMPAEQATAWLMERTVVPRHV
jgi:diguanylate cyclase (GGDEF)-like protein